MRETKVIIHLENLRHNIGAIKKYIGSDIPFCIPVKADAYGHGAVTVARTLVDCGVPYLAVAAVSEGIELRQAGISVPVLVLSIPSPSEFPLLAEYNLSPLAGDAEIITGLEKSAAATGKTITVHLKIDTGMGRIGCFPQDAAAVAKVIAKSPHLVLEGTCTHLAASDSCAPDDTAYTRAQLAEFSAAVASIRAADINPGLLHAASSGGILCYPESYFDMVRPGIIVYGYMPDPCLNGRLDIRPVMEFSSYISALRFVAAGTSISYGRTWTAPRDTWIGTIPVGYADGWNRALSNNVSVLVNGAAYPLVGRICMDQCMADFGSEPTVSRWETVTLFGPDPAGNSAAGIAQKLGTIPYEITCAVAHRVPRIYTTSC